jgi:putative intracellular protease/amidase
MWDLPGNTALEGLLSRTHDRGAVVAAVCHGPAGLVGVLDAADRPIVAGRRVSAFTNSEEVAVGLMEVVPFALESRLRELGARFEGGPDFQPYAVADGNLVTGQNPASSERVAELALAAAAGRTSAR